MKYCFLFLPSLVLAREILVVADKTSPKTFKQTSSVKTFHREEIIASQAQTVIDLLRHMSGLQVHMRGVFGKTSSIFLRGTDSRHTLVLIDGIDIGDPTSIHGTARLEFLSLQDIDKIEIIKGSQSVLYGQKAVGGVIKITTIKGGPKRQSLLKLGYGQFDNKTLGFSHSGRKEKLSYMLSGGLQKVQGISNYPKYKNPNADSDPYSNTTVTTNLEYELYPGETVSAGLRLLTSTFDYDNYNDDNSYNHASYISNSYHIKYRKTYTKIMNPEITHSSIDVKRELFEEDQNKYNKFLYKGRERNLEIINKSFYRKNNHLLVGFKHKKETATALGDTQENIENTTNAFYANHFLLKGRFFSDQGIRYSRFQFAGNKLTYKLGLGLDFNQTTLKTSYSTGLKSPSLFSTHGSFAKHRELQPESSRSFEVGILQKMLKKQLDLTYFNIEYDQYINFQNGQYVNTGNFNVSGLELELEGPVKESFVVRIHSTLLNSKNRQTGARLPYRPSFRGGFVINYIPHDTYEVGINLEAVGKRKDYDHTDLSSYSVTHLNGTYYLMKNHSLQVKIGNIFDKKYEEVSNYATLGRNIQLQYLVAL